MTLRGLINEDVYEIGQIDGVEIYDKDFVREFNKTVEDFSKPKKHNRQNTEKGYITGKTFEFRSNKDFIYVYLKQYHLKENSIVGAKASLEYWDKPDLGDIAEIKGLLRKTFYE